jgi:hypothetical protein
MDVRPPQFHASVVLPSLFGQIMKRQFNQALAADLLKFPRNHDSGTNHIFSSQQHSFYTNSIKCTYMYATYLGLYLCHPQACQYKNHGTCIDKSEEGVSIGRNL